MPVILNANCKVRMGLCRASSILCFHSRPGGVLASLPTVTRVQALQNSQSSSVGYLISSMSILSHLDSSQAAWAEPCERRSMDSEG